MGKYPVSFVDMAPFALEVYNTEFGVNYNVGEFTKIYDSKDKHQKNPWGYFGAMYWLKTGKNDGVVIFAHRGTATWSGLAEDSKILFQRCFSQLFEAADFYSDCLRSIAPEFCNPGEDVYDMFRRISIYHTGHSMGAVISDVMSSIYDFSDGAYNFENPGSKKIFERFKPEITTIPPYVNPGDPNKCFQLQSFPSMINTCNEQMGQIYRFSSRKINYDFLTDRLLLLPKKIGCDVWENLAWYLRYSIQNHEIKDIADMLAAGDGHISSETSNIHGFQEGHKSLFELPKYHEFWEGLFEKIWEQKLDKSETHELFIQECMDNIFEQYNQKAKAVSTAYSPSMFGSSWLPLPFGVKEQDLFSRGVNR